eukprot:scaffold156_cov308-Prasinococcus_capsulatus_cf.AAC.18
MALSLQVYWFFTGRPLVAACPLPVAPMALALVSWHNASGAAPAARCCSSFDRRCFRNRHC